MATKKKAASKGKLVGGSGGDEPLPDLKGGSGKGGGTKKKK